MAQIPPTGASLRAELATYGTTMFGLCTLSMGSLVIPLWAVMIGASPFWIGMAVGARSLLPLFLSIHGGTLMDRLGVRRVMLMVATAGLVLPVLYPLFPSVAALIVLQLLMGLVGTFAWNGAQTMLGQIGRGHSTMAGRFTLATTAGSFVGPLLGGIVWQHFGPNVAFPLMSLWALGTMAAVRLYPAGGGAGEARPSLRAGDLVPRLADYAAAVQLALVPAMSLVVLGTFVRNIAYGTRQSFYSVYLDTVRIDASEIGLLLALGSVVGGPAALLVGPLARRFQPYQILIASQILLTLAISLTPLFVEVPPLAMLAVLFGLANGLNLPTLLMSMSGSAEPGTQGLASSLRTTVNIVGAFLSPVIMGIVAQWFGLSLAFYVVGALALVMLIPMVPLVRRMKRAG